MSSERERALREALIEAARSLDTVARWQRGEEGAHTVLYDMKGYAGSRARVAREALAANPPTDSPDGGAGRIRKAVHAALAADREGT